MSKLLELKILELEDELRIMLQDNTQLQIQLDIALNESIHLKDRFNLDDDDLLKCSKLYADLMQNCLQATATELSHNYSIQHERWIGRIEATARYLVAKNNMNNILRSSIGFGGITINKQDE
jgi:hypothetical protein